MYCAIKQCIQAVAPEWSYTEAMPYCTPHSSKVQAINTREVGVKPVTFLCMVCFN